jgi:HEPN domain-containing protein
LLNKYFYTPTKIELKDLAILRLEEARKLFADGYYDGACYLGGYCIELALKAAICTLLNLVDYPPSGDISKAFRTHKLEDLITLAGLKVALAQQQAVATFYANWSLILEWSEIWRYNPKGTKSVIRILIIFFGAKSAHRRCARASDA